MNTTGHTTGLFRIWLALALLIAPQALASVCTVVGYVNYEDGRPAMAELTVTDIDLGTTYSFRTGGEGWPMQNFYMKSFTCNWQDRIILATEGQTKVFEFDKYPYEVNFTIAVKREQTPKPGAGAGGGAGGGGTSGGPATAYDFCKAVNKSEVNKVGNNSRIRWYVVNDTLGIQMIIGDVTVMDGYVIVRFNTGQEVRFDIGETHELDLDNDGKKETRGQLVEIKDGSAYMFFDKIVQLPEKMIEKSAEEMKPAASMPQKANRSLIVLGILLAISFALVIITDWKRRR